MYHPAFHNRRSIRLKGHDYSSEGMYFLTLCTKNRINIFGAVHNKKMILNHFGLIVEEEWKLSTEIRKNISLDEFIIMPNHIHGIIKIDFKIPTDDDSTGQFKSPSNTIGAIIRGFKGATTKRINTIIREERRTGESPFSPNKGTGESPFAPNKGSIWQRNYYESIIRNSQAYENIKAYIKNNPANWMKDQLKNG